MADEERRTKMRLKCRINNKDYEIAQGATFTDEFSEILDSGSILLMHVPELNDLKPFDDVYIYSVEYNENGEEIPFNGFNNKYIVQENRIKINKTPKYGTTFFKMDNNYINDTGYPVKVEKVKVNDVTKIKISGHIITHLIKQTFNLYTDSDDIKYSFYHQDDQNTTSGKCYMRVSYNDGNTFLFGDFYFDVGSPKLLPSINGGKSTTIILKNDSNKNIYLYTDINDYCFYINVSNNISGINNTIITNTQFIDKNNKFNRAVSGKEYKKIHYLSGSNYNLKFSRWYDLDLIINKNILSNKENNISLIKNQSNNYNNIDDLVISVDEYDNTKCYIYNKNFYNADKDNSNILKFNTYDNFNDWYYNNNLEEGQFVIIGLEDSVDREIYIKQDGEIVLFDLYDNIFGKTTLTLSGDYYIGNRTIIEPDINGHRYNGVYHAGYRDHNEIIIQDVDKSSNYFLDTYEKTENTSIDTNENRKFYKHMLVDNFRENLINLKEKFYNYTIQLCSETKYLERVILPNISITQPLKKSEKRSVWEYMNQFVNLYSSKVKYVTNDEFNYYKEQPKYSLDPALEELFGKTYAPDFSLNNPSLREVLSKLMVTKDCIPYVKDNVIYAMDISQTTGKFDMNHQYINYIEGSMSSQDYTNNLRTNYNGALSQENSAHLIEYLGFRNSNESLLTIENMRLETRFPIYKINKLYMCYHKNISSYDAEKGTVDDMIFLCKQDITPLVKLNSERNILPSDWYNFTEEPPKNIEELSKYKLATVGYDIGSNQISGWGTKYTYPSGFWDVTKSYIQNIFEFVDKNTPYGIKGYNLIKKHAINKTSKFPLISYGLETVINPFSEFEEKSIMNPNDKYPLIFKGFIFEIDYNAMYSGTTVHSKNNEFGDITTVDNPSASLTILESDGVFEKEKINRLGNKTYKINARYTGTDNDYLLLQPVGSYYDDKIVYRREYSIYNNEILCNYQSSKDYTMKSYFNSVYSKHRPFNLLGVGESTTRAENRKSMILFSKDKCYYETSNNLLFNNFDNVHEMLVSCIKKEKNVEYINEFDYSNKINTAILSCNGPNYIYDKDNENYIIYDYSVKNYLSDINAFTNGYSLCFNCKMYDNVSSGVYIDKALLQEKHNNITTDDVTKDIVGSGQKWHMTVDNIETGMLKNIGVYFAHVDKASLYYDDVYELITTTINDFYKDVLFKLPKNDKIIMDNIGHYIGNNFEIYKDNKEVLDFTFQLEPISMSDDIIISPWFMKLNDMIGSYNKFSKEITLNDLVISAEKQDFYSTTVNGYDYDTQRCPRIILELKNIFDEDGNLINDNVNKIIGKEVLGVVVNYGEIPYETDLTTLGKSFYLKINEIKSITKTELTAICDIEYKFYYTTNIDDIKTSQATNVEIIFSKTLKKGTNSSSTTLDTTLPNGQYGKIFSKFEWTDDAYKPVIHVTNEQFGLYSYISPFYVRTDENVEYTATYPQNMFIFQRQEPLEKYLVQEELDEDDIEKYKSDDKIKLITVEDKTENIFSVKMDEQNRTYINVNLTNANLDNTKSTIEYWYYDTDYPTYTGVEKQPYHKGSDSYHLVFAVNVTEEDWERGYIKIYMSLVDNANMKVFDNNNNLIGYSMNYAEEGNTEIINGKQRFTRIKN